MIKTVAVFSLILLFWVHLLDAQESDFGYFHGNYQVMMQSFKKDSLINAFVPDEKIMMFSWLNLTYSYDKILVGTRFESALNPLPGFDSKNNGTGFPYRFVSYADDDFEITVGSFYEQFGNGLILRSYEDKSIDFDNTLDGVRVKSKWLKGTVLKGIYARQREYFSMNEKGQSSVQYGPGIIRGCDAELFVNDLFSSNESGALQATIGGSVVSKYQDDNDPVYKLPENVMAASGRFNLFYHQFNLNSEYAYKINDPSADNNYIFKPGQGLLVNLSFSQPGLGIIITAKRIDNMSFRSDRDAGLNRLSINYLPVVTRNHLYTLSAMYPYATQPGGEAGIQAEVMYKFKKGSFIGGENGTQLAFNFSRVNNIEKEPIDIFTPVGTPGTLGYHSDFLAVGDELFFQDMNIEISKKIKNIKTVFTYMNLIYNFDVIKGVSGHEMVHANIEIADITWSFKPKHALHFEIQALQTKQDMNDWMMGMVEYSISPKWFFTVSDLYNYSNKNHDLRIHYYNMAIAYNKNAIRLQIAYGKQRQGVICAGGICRNVPASNGFMLTLTGSF